MLNHNIHAAIATLGPIGKLPAPGTMGSLVALILGGLLIIQLGHIYLTVILFLIIFIGYFSIKAHYEVTGIKDAGEVVIDEVIGQWLPLLVIPYRMENLTEFLFSLFFAFILFRFFDISKIGPIKKAESLPGAFGVLADDILAGISAGVILLCLFSIQ